MPVATSDDIKPLDDTKSAVAALWREVLDIDELPEDADNFFALGGDSMTMVILEFRIKEELRIDLPTGAVLGAPTLSELCGVIDAAKADLLRPSNLP